MSFEAPREDRDDGFRVEHFDDGTFPDTMSLEEFIEYLEQDPSDEDQFIAQEITGDMLPPPPPPDVEENLLSTKIFWILIVLVVLMDCFVLMCPYVKNMFGQFIAFAFLEIFNYIHSIQAIVYGLGDLDFL